MTTDVIVKKLKSLARWHTQAAEQAETQSLAELILEQRRWIVSARRELEQLAETNGELRERLVKQACYFERIEAQHEPKWPLMDGEDPGAAL
jgi:predicted RNA binding protein with dsRBD fold (UPF0201 family)